MGKKKRTVKSKKNSLVMPPRRCFNNYRVPVYVPLNPRDPLGLENPEAMERPEIIIKKIYRPRRRSKSTSKTARRQNLATNPGKYPFGNCPYFYANRNPLGDNRVRVMERAWFEGKSVLDVGCNIGSLTLAVALQFQPRRITGIDIDPTLISSAWRNIKNYKTGIPVYPRVDDKPDMVNTFFPVNVEFRWENYADEAAEVIPEKYDLILALSVIKWIHLAFGDDALKRCFKRFFTELKPSGLLLLEYQSLHFYQRRKNCSVLPVFYVVDPNSVQL
ncbi:probable RNA methyltransferase Y17G7B.18 [Octopus sinensis]|uniref:RNA methyltransferase n=1 Tax=Octopus sinensis TaxID=2607531 RepID=A0A6P7TUF2_9MOLL|nr:probable RNA methyltransferase Y17G7B.18 [Octopus sinensis]